MYSYSDKDDATNITRPSQVTPELLREHVRFTNSGFFSTHGYNEEEVDTFLDVVANKIEDLETEVVRLQKMAGVFDRYQEYGYVRGAGPADLTTEKGGHLPYTPPEVTVLDGRPEEADGA